MRRRWATYAASLFVFLLIWEFLASLGYCLFTNRMALFVWPFDQWLTVTRAWSANWLMPILIIWAGIWATAPFILAFFVWLRFSRRGIGGSRRGRKLYGDIDGFASRKEMQRNGIRTDSGTL